MGNGNGIFVAVFTCSFSRLGRKEAGIMKGGKWYEITICFFPSLSLSLSLSLSHFPLFASRKATKSILVGIGIDC